MPHVFIDSFSQISAETRAGLPTWAAVGRNFSNIFDFVWILPQAVFSKAFNVQFPSWTDDRVSPLFPSQLSTFVYNRQKSDSVEGPQQINLNCSQSDRLLYIPKQSVFSTLPPSKSSPSFPQYTLAPDHHYKTLLMTFRACYNLAPLLLTAWGLITLNF